MDRVEGQFLFAIAEQIDHIAGGSAGEALAGAEDHPLLRELLPALRDVCAPLGITVEPTHDPELLALQTTAYRTGQVLDLAGNVAEWTSSAVQRDQWLARGGAFFLPRFNSSSVNRIPLDANYRDANVGFRVCSSFVVK